MKKVLMGFIVGILIASTTAIYAASGNMIEVFYNIKDIVINGKSNMPDQKPFVYKGSTYVPLRYVSDKLGYDVDYKGGIVYIGSNDNEGTVYPANGIESMNTQTGSFGRISYKYMDVNIFDNIGNKHNSYILFSNETLTTQKMFLEFPTNGQYSKFVGKIALTDKLKSTRSTMAMNIYADDKMIFTEGIIAGYMPKDISIDIKDAIKVKIEFTNTNSDSEIAIFEPAFN